MLSHLKYTIYKYYRLETTPRVPCAVSAYHCRIMIFLSNLFRKRIYGFNKLHTSYLAI